MADTKPKSGPGSPGDQVAELELKETKQEEKATVIMAKAMGSTRQNEAGPAGPGDGA
jgi:hypothetical protein